MIGRWLAELQADPLERLRWYVTRELGIEPYGQTDEQVVKCGLHLLAERQEQMVNPGFDPLRFSELKGEQMDEA